MLVSLGIAFYAQVQLTTGSSAGLALLLHYVTGIPFGWLFFAINLPFYALAWFRMGLPFTLKTIASVAMVSYFSSQIPVWIGIERIEPLFAALVGGGLMGLGILSLFRHKASVGGINILALFLQDNFGIRAGYFQLGVDAVILVIAFFVLPFDRVLYSILGALVLNMIIALNHRPGRYVGFS
jgi:uncharacterized membrane-anchored protein YitT (DUF2179 family)